MGGVPHQVVWDARRNTQGMVPEVLGCLSISANTGCRCFGEDHRWRVLTHKKVAQSVGIIGTRASCPGTPKSHIEWYGMLEGVHKMFCSFPLDS